MSKELAKTYDPKGIEERLYTKWMDNGYFHAKVNPDKKPFTIVMPPPNVTGQLHMGHALDETMQDILIRFKRMQGYEALWQPGTDHAAIATEVKVIDKLKKEGIDKHDIGREEFLKHAWAWKEEYGGKIINQLKKLGASADWERERFTMDEGCSKAVQEVFIKLYEKGYIYKGSRIINWCPVCQTSISDAEVEHEDQDGFFWHINYPIVGEEGRFVEIATTRPETLLGDTAVAVNPEDERYKDLIGKMLKLPLTDREIPVIADEYVDKEFGTGCVKITPAHDPNDFEVGRRHNLEEINIMNDDATINELGGKYAGMDRYEARKAMVADLEELGLPVVKVQHHYAHILSCMAENDCAEQVIGISFDGTGYGTDGTIWGGEILLADLYKFKRVGSVVPFLQIGGDASSKEGWRIAVSLIYGMTGDREKAAEIIEKLAICTKQEANVQFTMADRKINAVMSTSAGRLFDGVSAILGIRRKSTFEGEASMALEFAAEEYQKTLREKSTQQILETEKYSYHKKNTGVLVENKNQPDIADEMYRKQTGDRTILNDERRIVESDRLLLNTESLIKELMTRCLNDEDPGRLAYFFHRELAYQIIDACVQIRQQSGCNKVALSGGVFQNRLLLELTDHGLKDQGFEVLKHQLVPPNDGGIALGQAVYAMEYLEKNKGRL